MLFQIPAHLLAWLVSSFEGQLYTFLVDPETWRRLSVCSVETRLDAFFGVHGGRWLVLLQVAMVTAPLQEFLSLAL